MKDEHRTSNIERGTPNGEAARKSGPPKLAYDQDHSDVCQAAWNATCGPHAIAAACGVSVQDVGQVLENYKGWMNPTQVSAALKAVGREFDLVTGLKTEELAEGISRIQWEGPWLDPGKPAALAYKHTHYVAHFRGWVLCTAARPAEWIEWADWYLFITTVPPVWPFHVTHHWRMKEP